MYNTVAFGRSPLCAASTCIQSQDMFFPPEGNPVPLSTTPHSLLSAQLPLKCFLFLWICLFLDISYERNHAIAGLRCLASLAEHHVLKVHPRFWVSASLLFGAEYYSAVWYTTFALSIHLSLDIYIVSTLCLVPIVLLFILFLLT